MKLDTPVHEFAIDLAWESAELYPGLSCKPGSIQESTMSSLSKTIKTWLANILSLPPPPPHPNVEHPPITKDVTRVYIVDDWASVPENKNTDDTSERLFYSNKN